jgi:hypothetical protein
MSIAADAPRPFFKLRRSGIFDWESPHILTTHCHHKPSFHTRLHRHSLSPSDGERVGVRGSCSAEVRRTLC